MTLLDHKLETMPEGVPIRLFGVDTNDSPVLAENLRPAANVLELRNGATAQLLRAYNTYTSDTDYERFTFGFIGNVALLSVGATGTGIIRPLTLGGNAINFQSPPGSTRWQITASGHWTGQADNAYDLGIAGARARNGHFGGYVLSKRLVTVDADGATLTEANAGTLYSNEGAAAEANFVLPSAVANLRVGFVCQDNSGIKVTAAAGDTIAIGASVSAAAGNVASTVPGSVVELVCINATEWVATSSTGTWVVT